MNYLKLGNQEKNMKLLNANKYKGKTLNHKIIY